MLLGCPSPSSNSSQWPLVGVNAQVISDGYPRGKREMLGALSRFSPTETAAWFRSEGVTLKTEADGRMFPVTDDSQTIIDALGP